MENTDDTESFPVSKVAHGFLKESVLSSSFSPPGWNNGRVISQHSQLKRLLAELKQPSSESSETDDVIKLSNTLIPLPSSSKTHTRTVNKEQRSGSDKESRNRRQKELISSTVQ